MPDRPGVTLLLDTASLYFRAFYGVPTSVRSPDGQPVNAVRGLLEMIARLVADRRPTHLVACWDDDWRPAFRVAAVPTYKAHRLAPDGAGEQVPPELAVQVPVIAQVLAAVGIARLGAPGYEADDVIATLATRAVAAGQPVDVVTGDRDLFQLVDDEARVRVLYTVKGIRDLLVVDQAELARRYGVADGAAYADLAVLRGDPSDGLPGVPGVGEKTATALVQAHGSLAGVLAALDDPGMRPAVRARLVAARDYLDVAPAVVRVVRTAPVARVDTRLPLTPADPDALAALAERWGLASAVRRLTQALAG
ncbi:5'-3' exonuclease [Cellulomonas citrea]|uniref:5'-3' exonuclease n=1 Tax=Cellulomonas citrea TaxID=1909423 RepID=UPI001F3373EB|nr:5'-3' exonuclease [Cellulomonas citrea]